MKNIVFIILTLFFFQSVYAQSISITGQWNYTIPTTDITEAGKDFSGTYTSSVNQVFLDINHPHIWKISVKINNIDWDDNLRVYVRRTGNGWGSGRISGTQNYKQTNNKGSTLINGNNLRYDVPLQYQIRNVSVTIPAHNYIAEIVYTLSAN